ncbi:hypothetical protein COJ85_20795 [Bacillus sp. AFS076308]|uniref:DUF3231 family protein n=1 Tax=unclassified Bacillus (in: firmicutes) TaxID=185979 RepID=UPI000BF37FA5|nr:MULTISPECIES: DUF3231 family protein [unclassified Bacillus (in: firmicutes)]PFN98527.1 hypothetical protein COJ85_20795 [Bacillus sp. AFS076308]PGV53566.1 hypothetical protein COD92_08300 [Bacillus sp. AFS037270]
MKLFDMIHDAFEPFMDGEKRPLNVMEVSNLWFFLLGTETTMRNEEIGYNIALDPELKQILKDIRETVHVPIRDELIEFLKKEGIPLTKTTSEKPLGDFQNIPEGAKLNDEELVNLMSYNLAMGVNYAARGLTESIRADVGLLFSKIIMRKTMAGLTVKQYLERHEWLRIPPYYKG